MASQLLVAYIRDRLGHGYSPSEVKQLFVNRGWREIDVDVAIQVALGNAGPGQPVQRAQPVHSFQQPRQQPSAPQRQLPQPSMPAPAASERTLLNAPSYSPSVSIDTAKLTKIVAGLAAMLLVIGIAYVLFFQSPSSTRFEIKVMSGEKALDGAEVRVYDNGKLVGTAKTVKGVAVFSNLPPKLLTFKISKTGYGEIEESYDTTAGSAATTELVLANATEATPTPTATLTPASNVTAPLISGISVNATNTSAAIKWITDKASNSTLLYGLSASYGQSAGQNDNTTSHSVTASSLAANKTYYYKIVSCAIVGTASNCSSATGTLVTITPVITYTCSGTPIGQCIPSTGDKCISDPFAGAVPYPSCTTCACPSGKTCNTATGACTANPTPTPTSTPSPGCTVGAACGTTSCSAGYSGSCTQTYSSSCTCQSCTLPTCTLLVPTISSVTAVPGDTAASITWTTNHNSTSAVYYGTTTAYGSKYPTSPSDNVTSHTLLVSGPLSTGTLYHYKVESCNSAGCTNSSESSFITTGAATLVYVSMSLMSLNTTLSSATVQFSLSAIWSNGTSPDVTEAASWTDTITGDTDVLNSAGLKGKLSIGTTTPGSGTITATYSSKQNITNTIYVKQVPTAALTINQPTWSVLYGTSTTVTCSASACTAALTRGGQSVSPIDTQTLGAASYQYICSIAETATCTAASNSSTLIVTPKPITCSFSSPALWSAMNSTPVTVSAANNESQTPILTSGAPWCAVLGGTCTGNADNANGTQTSFTFTSSFAAGNYSGCSNSSQFTIT